MPGAVHVCRGKPRHGAGLSPACTPQRADPSLPILPRAHRLWGPPAGRRGPSLPLRYWMARATTATPSSRARATATAQSSSSSWLREARRLSSGPVPFRNPTWAGAGPAIAPQGDPSSLPPLPSPSLARLPEEVGAGASVCGAQGTSPGELMAGAGGPPTAARKDGGPGFSAAFWLPPSTSRGQPGLAGLPAPLLLPARLWARRGPRRTERERMAGPGQTHLHTVGRGAAVPRRLRPLIVLQRGTLVVRHLPRQGAGWDGGVGAAAPHPAVSSGSYGEGWRPLSGCAGGPGQPLTPLGLPGPPPGAVPSHGCPRGELLVGGSGALAGASLCVAMAAVASAPPTGATSPRRRGPRCQATVA